MAPSIIANPGYAEMGKLKISWARKHMPIMSQVVKTHWPAQPLDGYTIVTSVHLEAKTACLVQALTSLGAEVYATGCNPLSTQDDVAAALAETYGVTVYARHNHPEEYQIMLKQALSHYPHIIIDDGGDLVELLHGDECADYGRRLIGGCEETTTGVHRLKARIAQGTLNFPMFDVNDADCKHLFDNYYGTGQSVITAIMNNTNLTVAGKTFVIAGYGDCGSGIAKRAHGMGAKVIITEINSKKALRAYMDGYTVMPMDEAAAIGDVFITSTGCKDVITRRHFDAMKDGAILANAGHFNVEISVKDLSDVTASRSEARKNVIGYNLADGKTLYLLAEGRLVNLAAGDGHPVEIMDMSFSIQLLSVIHIATNLTKNRLIKRDDVKPGLYPVPSYIDDEVASIALGANHIRIDHLSDAQRAYLENGF